MAKIHILGNARIGENRELKFALERYWHNESTESELNKVAKQLRHENFNTYSELDFIQVGDFSLYDHVLDASSLFGNLPKRASKPGDSELNNYFRAARGRSQSNSDCCNHAGEMTKWFNTNYHYIVPEFDTDTEFSLNPNALLEQIAEAKALGADVKPVIIGPVTYLYLGKHDNEYDKIALLDKLLPVYLELFSELYRRGIDWLQLDEPALVLELESEWQLAYRYAYKLFSNSPIKLLLTTYFGKLADNLKLVSELPVAGVHIDVTEGYEEAMHLAGALSHSQVLSLGVINGRNIWRSNLTATLNQLSPIAELKKEQLWLAPSCSLLHVPIDVKTESLLNPEIKPWLAFGRQKIEELHVLQKGINKGLDAISCELQESDAIVSARKGSSLLHHAKTQGLAKKLSRKNSFRTTSHNERVKLQNSSLRLPKYPTTTIGSFPQTKEIRKARSLYNKGELAQKAYEALIKQQIEFAVSYQEEIGLDVLVHGEAERNDMVEYFGELLEGICQTQLGWVQSYGSRCVKPPIIYGDVYRSQSLSVNWTNYAQSLTKKPMKGMLTGPVTILNWSFVRDDQTRKETCRQIALAVKEEVLELESNQISIIQVDEAALREGLPLKKKDWQNYLDWATECFRVCVADVQPTTQIHTHMCYSEFDDILPAITNMDADVITIESARSDHSLLESFKHQGYQNQIGPGVYDIHSPNTPTVESVFNLIRRASSVFKPEQIWVNPDCGLKTRKWDEVKPALKNMVAAAQELRK